MVFNFKRDKERQSIAEIPVAIYTTSNLNKDEEECRRLGGSPFCYKAKQF
jgi:hypothetical protein